MEITLCNKALCRDLFTMFAHNVYSRTLSSLEDNLKMASEVRNMLLSSVAIKYTLIDIVVFDYIPFPIDILVDLKIIVREILTWDEVN